HPDGLADPGGYLRRLRDRFPGWIVAEKILHPGEEPPASWPIDGTTGYDALREVCGLFVDPAGEAPLTRLADSLGAPTDLPRLEEAAKEWAAGVLLAAETDRIARVLTGGRPDPAARRAVAALLASFPVYRTYLPEGERYWTRAVAAARRRLSGPPDPPPGPGAGDGRGAGEGAPGGAAAALAALEEIDRRVREDPAGELAVRIQQTSGMVMAKGVEDTAFYRATRFAALNEVGGDPGAFGTAPEEFHAAAARREAVRPAAMTTLSTHDTKRSEDVRA